MSAKTAAEPLCPSGQAPITATIVPIAFGAAILISNRATARRIAADDNPMKLMSIAMKPLAAPPFPLDAIEEMTKRMGGDGELKW